MDILKILKDVETRTFFLNDDLSEITDNIKELLDSSKEQNVFYVGISAFVLDYYKNNPTTEWKIKNIFQLGYPYLFFESKNNKDLKKAVTCSILKDQYWMLFEFTKKDFTNVIIGFIDNNINRFSFKHYESIDQPVPSGERINKYFGKPLLKEDYSYPYYFNLINDVIEADIVPEITEDDYKHHLVSFNSIPQNNFYLKYLSHLSRYKKSVTDDFGFPLESEKILSLNNIVQILRNEKNDENIIYPKERDIITNGLFINEYTSSVDRFIQVATGKEKDMKSYILRSFDLNPYFLWVLLNSEFIQDFCLSEFECWWNDYVEIPIEKLLCFIPRKINESYFQKKYEMEKQTKLTIHKKLENDSVFFDKNAKQIILRDLTELRLCIKSRAYKAAIIMAGSILEAFLIDWLCEIDRKDYFAEDYTVIDKKYNHPRRADLKDYIDEIQKKRPDWIAGAKKATEIRKKRNLVHAKLYISEGEITQDICYEMLQNLEAIINNRWN